MLYYPPHAKTRVVFQAKIKTCYKNQAEIVSIELTPRATPIEEAQRGRHPKRKRIKKKLLQIVRDVYQVHSVPGLSVSEFVDHAVGYLKSTVFSAASVMPKGSEKSQVRQCLFFTQLICRPTRTKNQLYKNPNIV